jgi:NADH-quinone oxidoreductase subunit C
MTPEEVGAQLAAGLEQAEVSVSGGGSWARATVDVPPPGWREAVRTARDQAGLDYFDWLSAVDELSEGFTVVVHLWSTAQRHGALIRCRVPRAASTVDSIVDIYPGAAWPERETHEMFGIHFEGHPDLKPLLLPPEFEGHPLRKEFVLASRVAKDWPGAKEPGESHDPTAARRQKMRPPGVPDPNEWGPKAGTLGSGDDEPRPRGEGRRPDRPAARGDRPAARGDRPAARGDRPAARGDRPVPRGDQPGPSGEGGGPERSAEPQSPATQPDPGDDTRRTE